MVNFYVKRIRAGLMTVDMVPPKWRAEVGKEIGVATPSDL